MIARNDLFASASRTRCSRDSFNRCDSNVVRVQNANFHLFFFAVHDSPRKFCQTCIQHIQCADCKRTNEKLARTETKAKRMKFISDWNKFEHKIWNANDANIPLHYNKFAYSTNACMERYMHVMCPIYVHRKLLFGIQNAKTTFSISFSFFYSGAQQINNLTFFVCFIFFRSTRNICRNSRRLLWRRSGSHARLHCTRRSTTWGKRDFFFKFLNE